MIRMDSISYNAYFYIILCLYLVGGEERPFELTDPLLLLPASHIDLSKFTLIFSIHSEPCYCMQDNGLSGICLSRLCLFNQTSVFVLK